MFLSDGGPLQVFAASSAPSSSLVSSMMITGWSTQQGHSGGMPTQCPNFVIRPPG